MPTNRWVYALSGFVVSGVLMGTPVVVGAQTISPQRPSHSGATFTQVTATRASSAPRIDGSDQDAVWQMSERRSDFRTFSPREDGLPDAQTEFRVAYDDRALYIYVRAFDPRPDSIVRLLSRRDTDGPPNDQIQLFLDSYYDRRSGYEYIVNAAGVKSDYLLFDDTGFDQSWDGIWDAASRVDSLGWSAEFAIPLQQLRFRNRASPTFGLMVWRLVGRTGERVSWPLYRPSRSGYVSQTGTLHGIRDIAPSPRLQSIPYTLASTRNAPVSVAAGGALSTRLTAGADVRYLPAPNVSVDATFNPDFGQIESDPAVLDLSGFEVFQAERRPFFLQGAGQLSFPLATDGSALLFHSRRIGRAPALASTFAAEDAPTETTIHGAAMITTRPSPATSLVALTALTGREHANRRVVEPRAHYGVARLQRDFRSGRSGVGLMLTRLDRETADSASAAMLPRMAQAVALSTQHQTTDGNYRLNAWLAGSDVQGTPAAIELLQLSNVHGFQRPDDGVAFDSSRRELQGTAAQLFIGKVAGGVARYDASYRWISPAFDVNEMGFLTRAGMQSVAAHAGLRATRQGVALGVPYRTAAATLGFDGEWSATGVAFARGLSLVGTLQLPNQVQLQLSGRQELGGALCSMSCTRGGPALIDPMRTTSAVAITGDPRRRLQPSVNLEWSRDDGGRSQSMAATADLTWRARTNLDMTVAAYASDARHDAFFYRRLGALRSDTAHLLFARLDQPVRSLVTRLNFTMTPALTVQWYAQSYLSRGTYSRVRQLVNPRARRYEDRFGPYADTSVTNNPQGVDFRQFRSNTVVRWEYRPGSTLFVVWTQGRLVDDMNHAALRFGPDLRELFTRRPNNVVAIKASYWLSR